MPDEDNSEKNLLLVTNPQYIDKVMNYTVITENKETNKLSSQELSYFISYSFKGILRLTPNKDLGIQDSDNLVAYQDDPTPKLKTNKETIKVSDSDGYEVDLYIGAETGSNSIEMNNAYVIGPVKTNRLFLTLTKDTKKAFAINNVPMPTIVNDLGPIPESQNAADIPNKYLKDEKGKDISEQTMAKSFYILTSDGEKNYKYTSSYSLIEELVKEYLLDICSVPTGTITWFPLTIQQYTELYVKGHRPNVWRKSETELTDPIVRDYLLCDGSRYFTRDFPELAKVLYKQVITFERLYGAMPGRMRKFYHLNGAGYDNFKMGDTTVHSFRVPDLRHVFPKALYTSAATNNIITTDQYDTAEDMWAEYEPDIENNKNIPGAQFTDNMPTGSDAKNVYDKHFHFQLYGTYNDRFTCKERYTQVCDGGASEDMKSVEQPSQFGGLANHYPAVATIHSGLNGHAPYAWQGGGTNCHNNHVSRNMFFYNTYQIPNLLQHPDPYCYGPANSPHMVFSHPKDAKNYTEPTLGVTSYDISAYTDTNSIPSTSVGEGKEEYTEINGSLEDEDKIYGKENCPEFLACLPLIKI